MTQAVQPELIPTPESIALIDISYLFKKRWHTAPDGVRHGAAKATLRDLENLRKGVGHLIVCRDAAPYKRAEIYPAYKANRPVLEPEEREERVWLWEEIARLGYNVAWVQGYEADDVIATLAAKYSVWCSDVRIVGVDKDAAQCLTAHVTQYIPPIGDKDWAVRDVAAATEKFKVAPECMPLYQGLVGDASDNIPGVDGIGKTRAAELVNKYKTLAGLADGLVAESRGKPAAYITSLATNWETLVLSIKLATLDTNVPIDADALLVAREPMPEKEKVNSMDPEPEKPVDPALEEAARLYQEAVPRLQNVANDRASKDDLLEAEYERERQQNGETDTVSNAPGDKAAEPARASMVVPRTQLVKAPEVTSSKYGLVTSDLQPMDLTSAYQMSSWLMKGGLYSQYKSEAQIFTVMVRAKELGLGITTALANHHVIDGKPVASADLIRALAERDANFEYLMPIKMSATSVTWKGKHKRQPEAVEYTYTIEDAKQAGLVRKTQYGKDSGWMLRPQDFLVKTAGSKLARILWPGATMGCYCPEEMGYTSEELDAREAA